MLAKRILEAKGGLGFCFHSYVQIPLLIYLKFIYSEITLSPSGFMARKYIKNYYNFYKHFIHVYKTCICS